MLFIEILFWVSLAVLFFCYAGYGILLFTLNSLKTLFTKNNNTSPATRLPVTLIVAVYNEKDILEKKIKNSLSLGYPEDLLHIIFITDGSTDGSDSIVARHSRITLLHQQERRGKLAALKRAMQFVKTPLVIFSDANTILNKESIEEITGHYADPRVGGVAGEKKIMDLEHISAVGEAEGMYWQYESFMKKQDNGFYTVVGAAGELFSIRTSLFRPPDSSMILDDFIISMQVCLQGYKIAYEPRAFAMEPPSISLAEEEKRKVRISAGAYQSVSYLAGCVNFFKHPLLTFQYVSRRLLRWIACPPLLFLLLLTNILLVINHSMVLYSWILYSQIFFYAMVLPGWLMVRAGKRAGILAIPFYFLFMNYCLVKGLIRFLNGKQTVLWEKSLRQAVN